MGARVKICGVANAADAAAVAALMPDFMGFIFWPGSKRFVKPETVAEWAKDLPPIPRAGVFVDATPDEVRRAVETAGLSVAQLHGHEDLAKYRGITRILWQVVKIAPEQSQIANRKSQIPLVGEEGREDSQSLEASVHADALLLDTFSASAPGGTGETGDWNVARDFVAAATMPVLLAGGLTPANVREAIRVVRPWGVDVSSGVEERPGVKDLNKVKEFIDVARNN